jgi:hypothetical protein
MAATLPLPSQCCVPCEEPVTIQVPGPAGAAGATGATGAAGKNAYTTVAADLAMPGELGSVFATVVDTSWMGLNQVVWVTRIDGTVKAYMQVTAIGGPTVVTLKNLRDTASSAYLSNSIAGTINIGSTITAAGLQGAIGATTGAAGGDLKGTYPNPKISLANTLGGMIAGDGTDATSLAAGTNGQQLAADNTQPKGVAWKSSLPVTGGTDVADNRIGRLDGAAGTPIPIQSSRVTITDNGAIRADGSGGNARGTDAVDLQVTRGAATQVASGQEAVIGGGNANTASGLDSTVSGGISNIASGGGATVGGGSLNQATALNANVAGGDTNLARSEASSICGGDSNIAGDAGAANKRAFVGGGQSNEASGQESTIAGGSGNVATATQATVCGGDSNDATGVESFVGGGGSNIASGLNSVIGGGQDNETGGNYSAILGGLFGLAPRYGQQAHAAGRFAADGDAQSSQVMMRRATTDATPSELFLDGATLRLAVPSNTSWIFQILLVARSSAGLDSIYKSEGSIRNNAGTTTTSAVTTTEINDGIGLPATPVAVAADDPNDALTITVTGLGATNIRWVAKVSLVEVAF